MTGPNHYRAAEELATEGRTIVSAIKAIQPGEHEWRQRRDDLGKQAMGIWAQAQVHATLAQTALLALVHNGEMPARDADAWMEAVTGRRPLTPTELSEIRQAEEQAESNAAADW